MADPHVVEALRDKIFELRQSIVAYEEYLDRSRQELAVMTSALALIQRDGGQLTADRPVHVRNLFKRGEVWRICRAALSAHPEGIKTRDLAIACLGAKELDHEDLILVRGMVGVLANSLRKHIRKRQVVKICTGHRSVSWRFPRDGELDGLPPQKPGWRE